MGSNASHSDLKMLGALTQGSLSAKWTKSFLIQHFSVEFSVYLMNLLTMKQKCEKIKAF